MTIRQVQLPSGQRPLQNALQSRLFALSESHGLSMYLVGGYLRDLFIAKKQSTKSTPKDFDYAIAGGRATLFARDVAKELAAHYVPLDDENDTARVVLTDGCVLDFAGCLGADIKVDMMRRDFSINALYWDPKEPDVVSDLANGVSDIEGGLVRALGENSFLEDPLRMLRAFRFAALLGFNLDSQTAKWIGTHCGKLKTVAYERINYELFTTFSTRRLGSLILDMGECGILEAIFPELSATRQVTSNAFHHLGLFDHSLDAVLKCEDALAQMPDWPATDLDFELAFSVSRLAGTKIACLLHDIGKPQTWIITDEGKHTFIGHDRLGAEMVSDLADRQKWARPVERFVAKLVKWHLRPGQLFRDGLPTERALKRFFRNCGADVPELILLSLGDLGATQGPSMQDGKNAHLKRHLNELLDGFVVYLKESQEREKLLDGNEIMSLLKIEPGPLVGEILTALIEAQEIKEVCNRPQAERFVKEMYEQKRPK
jgi:putative nucleotidyltransferase with HDIG domain